MTPFAKAKDGSEIKNPFKDKRVRQAMTKAINRDAIVSRVMEGVAIPAGQFLPDGYFGVSTKLKPVAYDPDGAKKLLAEAGFPNGFKLTLHTPNGRYTNDVKIAEAVAQMLTRVGIETALEALPPAVFFTRASQGGPDNDARVQLHPGRLGARRPGENSGSLVPLVNTFDRSRAPAPPTAAATPTRRWTGCRPRRSETNDDAKRAALLAQGHRDRHRRTWRSSPRTTRSTPGRRARGSSTRRARTSTRWPRMCRASRGSSRVPPPALERRWSGKAERDMTAYILRRLMQTRCWWPSCR